MALLPATIEPQLIEVKLVVQLLSEYTPMFGFVVIVPLDDTFWFTLMAAIVETPSVSAVAVRMIIIILEFFANAIFLHFPSMNMNAVLRLNKHYEFMFLMNICRTKILSIPNKLKID